MTLSLTRIGNVQLAQGDTDEALKSYQAMRENCESLTKTDPNNGEWQYNLALSYGKLFVAFYRSGDRDRALDAARAGAALMQRLTALAPDNASSKNQRDWFEKRITALSQPPAQ